jgi:uncharacterized membrane protein
MTSLVAGLVLFLGTHSVSIVSPGWRERLVDRTGVRVWKLLYAMIALAGLILIVRGYAGLRGQTQILYLLPRWVHGISMVLMLPVFPLLLATYLPGMVKTAAKHPMLIAAKLWAVAHLLANGSVADVLLFGSILAWAVARRISLKKRPDRKAAAIGRPGQWNDLIVVIGGLMLYSLMIQFGHRLLIGMPLVIR